MSKTRVYLAVDLGAGSGRVLAGLYNGEKIELKEISRFNSEAVRLDDGWHWNFSALLDEIKKGIALALQEYGESVVSLGVDTWGVDYGLIDDDGKLLGWPFQYRDQRTEGMMDRAFALMPKKEIYRRTGIQFLFFNTLYQLLAEKKGTGNSTLLFMPDLVTFFLTGKKVNEESIASTGQLLDAATHNWDRELISLLGIPETYFGKLVQAGTDLGPLLPEIADELGGTRLKVIAVGTHDTASAVAGVPALEEEPVFLSSGTWSLMGRELKRPVLTEESFQAGFSNEAGVFQTTRFLKNISGMWLLQECKRKWDREGLNLGFDQLVQLARAEAGSFALIDPDAPELVAPEDMTLAIIDLCRRSGQAVPETPGQFTRIIFESLAAKYSVVKDSLEKITKRRIEKIHIVGGGSQNAFLNQLAANATGCEIVAGPVEATSLGNIVVQMIASGELDSLDEGRRLIARSFELKNFHPEKLLNS